jgi:hypothetical protein
MFTQPSSVHLRLQPQQAEFIYCELLGLLAHYKDAGTTLGNGEEHALLSAITQLELGIQRSQAAADLQLEQLRAAALRREVA